MPRKLIQWDTVRTDFITGDLAYPELARKHGISDSSVRHKAADEKWRELRAQWREQAARRTAESIGLLEVEFRAKQYRRALLMVTKGLQRIAQIDPSDLSVKEALDLVKAGHVIALQVLGLPDGTEAGEQHVIFEWVRRESRSRAP